MSQEVNTPSTSSPPPVNPRLESWKTFFKKLRKNKAAMFGGILILFFIIVAIIGPYITPYSPNQVNYSMKLAPPSADHWFGTDHHGRDIFSRIIHGMKITLSIGFVSVFASAIIGTIIGIISGYYGKRTDAIIMRIMDVLLAFPGILLALAIVSVLGPSIENVIIAVAIFSIPVFARIVRGSTLSVRKLEYIDAVKALGASDFRIIFKHILPNVTSPLIVQTTLSIATAILTASGLSFIGLGAQPPSPEWGAMLSDGRSYLYQAGHVALFPGMMIVIVVLAFNIFGDGLRDALDPKMKA
ncbi:diguanylate cyclase [Alkalihalobacillus alcalophilus ATCC 27647 = CGMCC 1.3604]|nr:nickel transporter permease [Alkalihalobacillus alcalophilus]AFV25947.1 dipeptide/oligopeptide transporter [Alkalihalobacillus alcalophilus ATCC 27647 = CGMCC 1.3604]KGA96139.1 diguanylate cyclase [Alkalihalobacillus alcalophilus ATCC 27647 = CGMCC 1.3604]MED1560372.1 ABC transporter permease [Alkalihalobacillus alcalophilus]